MWEWSPPCHPLDITLSSPCHHLARNEGDLDAGIHVQLVLPGGKADGDGDKSEGGTASKQARDIEGEKMRFPYHESMILYMPTTDIYSNKNMTIRLAFGGTRRLAQVERLLRGLHCNQVMLIAYQVHHT